MPPKLPKKERDLFSMMSAQYRCLFSSESHTCENAFLLFFWLFQGYNYFSRAVFLKMSRAVPSFHRYFLTFFQRSNWISTGKNLIIFHGCDILCTGTFFCYLTIPNKSMYFHFNLMATNLVQKIYVYKTAFYRSPPPNF